jgi:hypothetical protein
LKHSEYDNHINSYDHAHTQRLKELKQKESAMKLSPGKHKEERQNEREMRRISEFADARAHKSASPDIQVSDIRTLDLESEELSVLSAEQKQFLNSLKKAIHFRLAVV